MKLVSVALLSLLLPSPAAAQSSGVYIQAGPLLDVLATPSAEGNPTLFNFTSVTYEWNDINGDRIWQPGEEGAVQPSGQLRQSAQKRFAPGGSAAVGVFISPSVSLRVEGSFQGEHVTSAETSGRLSTSTKTRQAATTTDILVAAGWHQGQSRRASIVYLAGMVFRRQRQDTTVLNTSPALILGPGPNPTQSFTTLTFEQKFASTFYSAGVMAGLDVVVKLSERVAIVPQVRMVAANHDWSLRPAVAARWRP